MLILECHCVCVCVCIGVGTGTMGLWWSHVQWQWYDSLNIDTHLSGPGPLFFFCRLAKKYRNTWCLWRTFCWVGIKLHTWGHWFKGNVTHWDGFAFYCYILENEPNRDLVAEMAQEVYNNDLLQLMILNIQKFEFEVSLHIEKDGQIWGQMVLWIRAHD